MDNLIIIENKKFCPYCGHEITPTPEGQFICYCEDASKARQIEREAMQLEWNANTLRKSKPLPKFKAQTICAPIQNTAQKPVHHKLNGSNTVWVHKEEKYPEE